MSEESEYYVMCRSGGEILKLPILFATCEVEKMFNGTEKENTIIIVTQFNEGENKNLHFDPKMYKLSNIVSHHGLINKIIPDIIFENEIPIWDNLNSKIKPYLDEYERQKSKRAK